MAQSMTKSKAHILNFQLDIDDSCGLTALINDVRFHFMIEPGELKKSPSKQLYREYLNLITAFREAEEREEDRVEEQLAKVRSNKNKVREGSEGSEGKDSGIDVTADSDDDEYVEQEDNDAEEDEGPDFASAGMELRNWILALFADITTTDAPPDREPEESTLHEWYHGPTYFYTMETVKGEPSPRLLETIPRLEAMIGEHIPRMKIPKYMQNYKLPWLDANDLVVQSEVSMPPPIHPGQVLHKATGQIYFFKPVVADQPDSVKREIKILQQLAKLHLDIKFPHLRGFVAHGNSRTEVMGLLLENIRYPTPLTKLLRSSVDDAARAEWSRKSEKYVTALHDNGIIWGDAKADNFMVDADSELWIIDFGGSYTEGWIDPDISETLEGDDMGLQKIQAALEDPDTNTTDLGLPDEDEDECDAEQDKELTRSHGCSTSSSSSVARETASTLFVTEKLAGEEVTRTQKRKRAEREIDPGPVEEQLGESEGKKRKRAYD
ncbi:hypothetical protein ACJQWK_00557 [Exserohilum turcicum]